MINNTYDILTAETVDYLSNIRMRRIRWNEISAAKLGTLHACNNINKWCVAISIYIYSDYTGYRYLRFVSMKGIEKYFGCWKFPGLEWHHPSNCNHPLCFSDLFLVIGSCLSPAAHKLSTFISLPAIFPWNVQFFYIPVCPIVKATVIWLINRLTHQAYLMSSLIVWRGIKKGKGLQKVKQL